jgi:hypothetical protein
MLASTPPPTPDPDWAPGVFLGGRRSAGTLKAESGLLIAENQKSKANSSRQPPFAMYPLIPCDAMASALEMVCYGFTMAAVFVSYLVGLR